MEHKVHTYYRGEYRHTSYEIWTDSERWAAYLLIPNEQLDCQLVPEINTISVSGRQFANYVVYDNDVLLVVDDVVHGGVTLTEVTCNAAFPDRLHVRIGWDYSHYMSGYTDVDRAYYDVKKAIDALWQSFSIKVPCSTVGGWHSIEDGIVNTKGQFVSNAGIQWRKEQGWETE